MKKHLLFLFTLTTTLAFAQSNKSILFIGNSYTYVNNLPQLLHDLAITTQDTLFFDSYTPGGYTFEGHSTDPSALAKISQQPWDYVVLQEQSQRPSFSPAQVAMEVYPYAKILDSLILANNNCTKTIFYMTWGRKYGDASNCAAYPPVCTYAGMQQRLRESYLEMADSAMTWVSPVGAAFNNSIKADSTLDLYNPDLSHPSLAGSYLAACVFYARIYKKNPVGNTFTAGLPNTTAAFLQNIAKITVLDSINLWNEGKFEPVPAFTSSSTDSLVQFTNQTTGLGSPYSYSWDFGDGNFSTAENPAHIYTSPGNYNVTQEVSWRCFSDSDSQLITVVFGGTTGVGDLEENNIRVYPTLVNDVLYIDCDNIKIEKISIVDAPGKSIPVNFTTEVNRKVIDFSAFVPGIYIVKIITKEKTVLRKVVKQNY